MTFRPFLLLFFVKIMFLVQITHAQVQKRTQESFKIMPNTAKIGEEIDLCFYIDIEQDWYIYGTKINNQAPDAPETIIELVENNTYKTVGKLQSVNPKTKYDEIWEGNINYFEKKGEFKQRVKILKENPKIEGAIIYNVCSTVTGQCLAPTKYKFALDDKNFTLKKRDNTEDNSKKEEKNSPLTPKGGTKTEKDSLKDENQKDSLLGKNESEKIDNITIKTAQNSTANTSKNTNQAEDNFWWFLVLCFLGGLSALLTPCVFPMIPMTVTFFLKQSQTRAEGIRKALFFGSSIIVLYTILGVLVSFLFGATFANWLSTHWLPNLFFFGLLMFFACSFLGMFEIVLPSNWVNNAESQADKGGYYGVFFMAFVLALVSFSCTAPIVGSLLVLSSQGVWFKPVMGMLAYSSAVALPFTLFALFPSWLKSLPKSGGWLNSVKVVLGFLEIALALKFLSQADQVYHWQILDREVFLAIWIVIFTLIGFYLLGKLILPHDSKMEKIPVSRLLLAIFSFSFVVYMLPGMFGAPLPLLSGYLPPITTMEGEDLYTNKNFGGENTAPKSVFAKKKETQHLRFPHQLQGVFSYKEALMYAKKMNKPILLDFTGHSCANCRKMEENVWAKKEVLTRLQNDFILTGLYVDDRTELPKSEWYISLIDKEEKKTIGEQNADFQIERFKNNAQPYYCILDTEGNLLLPPQSYDTDVQKFVDFLEKGKEIFGKK